MRHQRKPRPIEPGGQIDAMAPGEWENENSKALPNWWAIADDDTGGINVYVNDEQLALFILHALRIRAAKRNTLEGFGGDQQFVADFLAGKVCK